MQRRLLQPSGILGFCRTAGLGARRDCFRPLL
jgi:hypothetical protein